MNKLIASFVFVIISASFVSFAVAQSLTTGAISGTVVDESGAVMASVVVTAKNVDTGAARETQTTGNGNFLLAQLDPGRYEVTAESAGFEKTKIGPITVGVSRVASLAFKLKIGSATAVVEVKKDAPLIELSNPNTTTTFDAQQMYDIPNPGMDMSYVATLTPGAIMNTSSGGNTGNVEFNGLPTVANDFTVDGLDANDPWTSVNKTGATGLQLGSNAIQEVSINTESYSVDQGRLGAAQINYVTKSGTDSIHGNAYEVWNGSALNTTNFFIKANPVPTPKPHSNVNEFGASLGGPIRKDKLFFFTDLEAARIVLPQQLSANVPSPSYESYVLQQLPVGGTDSVLGTSLPPQPAEVPFYQNMFKLLGDTSRGVPMRVPGCPFDVGGGTPPASFGNSGNGCVNQRLLTASPPAAETLWTIKTDYNASANDGLWFRFQLDNGQTTLADPVNAIFNSVTTAPQRSVAAGWTHVFGAKLVNQFNPGYSYSEGLRNGAPASTLASFPITYTVQGALSTIGGLDSSSPRGNKTKILQLNDNLSWAHGAHELKVGVNLRRLAFSSYDSLLFKIPNEIAITLPEFTYGAAFVSLQSFPDFIVDHISSIGVDTYAMDQVKITSALAVTFGLRLAANSDPISQDNAISRLNGTFATISHDPNRPLNEDIIAHQRELFASTQLLNWEPRAAIAYQVRPKTVLRIGAGLFAEPLAGFASNLADGNPPGVAQFRAGLIGPAGGIAIAPGVPTSAVDAAVAANNAFQSGFSSGVASCAADNPPANCIPAVNFTTFESRHQQSPYIMQWSAGIDQGFGQDWRISANYVGTRSVRMFYSDLPNAFQTFCSGCFVEYAFNAPADARFGQALTFKTGANSVYHGLQLHAEKRFSHGINVLVNYTWSHCLDSISNGGLESFNFNSVFVSTNASLRRLYGNCDFDVRHSLNASYVYQLPFHSASRWLNGVVAGWQVAGTIFLRSGFPVSVLSATPGSLSNGTPSVFANVVPAQNLYNRSIISGITPPGTIQWLNPSAFQSVIDPLTGNCFPSNSPQYCQDGNEPRNFARAPGFRWTDLDVTKRFRITEKVAFRFDAQFFNFFNHPNFGFPNVTAGIPSELGTLSGFGAINSTASPPTGLLGSGLGGDSSVRMIALRGTIIF